MSELDEFDLVSFAADLSGLDEDNIVRDALESRNAARLREYSKHVETELRDVEVESVRDYVRQSAKVADLHSEMQRCDGILAKMHEMLLGFSADLGAVSNEISSLQSESKRMSVKLRNRRDVEGRVGEFLEATALPPRMAAVICEGDVDERFLAHVASLDAKILVMNAGGARRWMGEDCACVVEAAPHVARLTTKAVARSREYLLAKIAELRHPSSNVALLQRSTLTKYRSLVAFLGRHAPEAAKEVREVYVETMSKKLLQLFRTYTATLLELELSIANKHDVVAVDEHAVRSAFTTRVSLSKRGDGFSLGDRDGTLRDLEQPPIIAHVAHAQNDKYPFEALFRSSIRHLVDATANEREFVSTFFFGHSGGEEDDGSAEDVVMDEALLEEPLSQIFGKALSCVLEALENKLFACHDVVGVLLVARLVDLFRCDDEARAASRRARRQRRLNGRDPIAQAGPAAQQRSFLQRFFESCDGLLRPRLVALLDANVRSARDADVARLGSVDITPHYVTRRYAELSAAALVLFAAPDAPDTPSARRRSGGAVPVVADEVVTGPTDPRGSALGVLALTAAAKLRVEVVELLGRLAEASFAQPKERTVFLINNYDQIVTIFRSRTVGGEALAYFEARLARQRELFVEEELSGCLARLIAFVKQTEAEQARLEPGAALDLDAALVERLTRDFAASWKGALERVHRDVLAYFANFVNGMELLKQVLTQLLLYYTRFNEIIRKAWRRPPPFTNCLVSTNAILVEIKKYSRTF